MALHNPTTHWICVLSLLLYISACEMTSSANPSGISDSTDAMSQDAAASDATGSVGDASEQLSDVTEPNGEDTKPHQDTADAIDATQEPDTPETADAASPGFWQPAPNTTWHWQLQGDLDTTLDVEVYDIDLFDTPTSTIAALQARGVGVICYFSAGSYEDWRADAGEFLESDYGDPMGNWPGEWWLDIRSANLREIMKARLDLAASKGCDAVEPDNVDGYQNATGLDLSEADQLDYNRFLAREAHARGLSIGLKNALGLVDALEPDFDWALNESCLSYDECTMLRPFINAGKAVFHAEYIDAIDEASAKRSEVCGDASIAGFSTLIFTWDLDGWALGCP